MRLADKELSRAEALVDDLGVQIDDGPRYSAALPAQGVLGVLVRSHDEHDAALIGITDRFSTRLVTSFDRKDRPKIERRRHGRLPKHSVHLAREDGVSELPTGD